MAAAAVAVSHGPKLASDSVEELQEELREELMNTYSEDIGKVNTSEVLMQYLEKQRPFSARLYSARSRRDPWTCSDQAVRQLFRASVKGPRCRYFPGSKVPALPICNFSLSRPITAREERLSRLRMLREQEMVILREAEAAAEDKKEETEEELPEKRFQRIENQLTKKAVTLIEGQADPDVAAIEEELNTLAEAMVTSALTQAVRNFKVDTLARILVQQALEQAASDLGLLVTRQE